MTSETPNTLKEMILLVRLTTGETLMTICLNMDEKSLFVAFPYKIVTKKKIKGDIEIEVPYLEKYCPFVKNQTFAFSFNNVIFAKDPLSIYTDTYINLLEETDREGIVELFKTIANGQSAKNMSNTDSSFFSNILRDDTISLDEQMRVIVTGNSTTH